ncbi:IS3 family transposase [Synechococcus sp. Cu2B8-bc1011]|uniref:IS3 family transposase n=1 Tax=Synechococcus sp. Cu2B8-bc1011 TaxID=3093725 RepID=UPI0039B05AFE
MARIDALYLEDPCSGSRRIVDYLAREGIPISCDRVRNLMRSMGLREIHQKPHNKIPGEPSERYPHSWSSSCSPQWKCLGHGHIRHPAAEKLPPPGRDRGSVF